METQTTGKTLPPLVVLTGPTAVGKTKLSIALAKRIGGEIISADSMQIYRHMDIGSAKIRPQEMEGVPHFLVDQLEPSEEFNVVVFQKKARQAMEEIFSRGHIPVLVGGTGFYIQAVLYDIDFTEDEDNSAVREHWERLAQEKGNSYLHQCLQQVDPVSAELIHENNRKRVIRALEFYQLNGRPISEHNARERQRKSPYDFSYFVLTDDRQKLYDRIDERVDKMIEEGLVEEVKALHDMGYDRSYVSMQGLGYKEILGFLEGEMSLEEAIYRIKRDTRHFAKRQLTWFRREKEVIWLNKPDFSYDDDAILDYMTAKIKENKGESPEGNNDTDTI